MKIALIAGEASGDKLGAALIDGFDAILEQPADFIGVAGPRMITRGMDYVSMYIVFLKPYVCSVLMH